MSDENTTSGGGAHPHPPAPGSMRRELATIAELSLPMMAAQGGLMLMGVVDTLMVGRISSLEMAAVALGNSVTGVIVVLGIGLAMGIEPLVAQALGSGDALGARRWMWQGLYVSAAASIPLGIGTVAATVLFDDVGIAEDIAVRATAYIWARLPGVFFNCTYAALRAYFASIGRTRPVLIAVLAANALNILLDWALVFGELGLPRLGAVGTGVATSACWAFMTAVLALALWLDPVTGSDGRPTAGREGPDLAKGRAIGALGWPIALQISAEVGIFTLVSTLIARFGAVQLAGHQIAITMASLSFMCAVGIANAASARVGFHIGADDTPMARRTGFVCIGLGGAFMGACGLGYLLEGERIASWFTPDDLEAQRVAVKLLAIAGVFAIADGVQAVAAGALRGAGDTRWTFYANVGAHWVIALPLALYLGHDLELGPVGYWWALSAGLLGVAVILTVRFAVLSRRPIARLEG